MILEGIEDEIRNPANERAATPQQWCERGRLQVEHVMPNSWRANWPLAIGETEDARKERINRIGNLTLLTPTKNAAVSNGPWFGDNPRKHKKALLEANTTFLMNRALVDKTDDNGWTIDQIDARCEILTEPHLPGTLSTHKQIVVQRPRPKRRSQNCYQAAFLKLEQSWNYVKA
jgi:hypothetical protein